VSGGRLGRLDVVGEEGETDRVVEVGVRQEGTCSMVAWAPRGRAAVTEPASRRRCPLIRKAGRVAGGV